MQLRKLDNSFYTTHTHIKEALDNHNGIWEDGKTRGYGIVIIEVGNHTFAIPLRSNIQHKSAYITEHKNKNNSKNKGLDFTKALLIEDRKYISDQPFMVDKRIHEKLHDKFHFITKKFNTYVNSYIKAQNNQDINILQSTDYRFSTLINYHKELGIK